MEVEQRIRKTFGQLEHIADRVTFPSTLSYRERAEMQKKHGCEYGRVYNFPNSLSVYDRLTADATVRQNLRSMRLPAAKPPALDVALSFPNTLLTRATGKLSSSNNVLHQPVAGRPSGFASNNNTPLLTRSFHEAAAASLTTTSQGPSLSSLHPLTLKSYYKNHQLDFLTAARPAAQTTNQTLRMLGTYSSDAQVARLLNVHIPAAGVKPGYFHPDVQS